MNKSMSLYLDFLRIVAAFGVLLVHANFSFFSDGLLPREELGNKLVMLFFVLSGYLIAYTTDKKKKGPRGYLIDRLSRLYSVVLPALLFTFLFDNIGNYLNHGFYVDKMAQDHQPLRYLVNLVFLSQSWGFCTKPSTNGPFWSIAYEFWYYMIFAAWIYLQGKRRALSLIVIFLLIGIKIPVLLPVWLFGVYAYKCSQHISINKYFAAVVFGISLAIIYCLTFLWDFSAFPKAFVYGQAPLYFSSEFVFDWVFGIAIAINLWSFNYISFTFLIPAYLDKVVRYLSSITFSLYLYHLPMLILVAALVPYNKHSYFQVFLILIIVVAVIAILSAITEKQRNNLKSFIKKTF